MIVNRFLTLVRETYYYYPLTHNSFIFYKSNDEWSYKRYWYYAQQTMACLELKVPLYLMRRYYHHRHRRRRHWRNGQRHKSCSEIRRVLYEIMNTTERIKVLPNELQLAFADRARWSRHRLRLLFSRRRCSYRYSSTALSDVSKNHVEARDISCTSFHPL